MIIFSTKQKWNPTWKQAISNLYRKGNGNSVSFDKIQDEIGTPIKTNGNTEKLAGIYEAFPRILETPGVNIAQNDAFGVKKTFAPGP
jgi:hypothetical protein